MVCRGFSNPNGDDCAAREFRGDIDQVTCKSSSFLFTAVLMFCKALVLFLGLYLSFLIRHVSSDFQESVWIFASSLIVLIACLVVLPLAYIVEMAAAVFYAFLACALLLSTAIVMGMMLGPKIWRLNEMARSSVYTNNDTTDSGGLPTPHSHVAKGSANVLLVRASSGGAQRPPRQRKMSVNSTVVHSIQVTSVEQSDEVTHKCQQE